MTYAHFLKFKWLWSISPYLEASDANFIKANLSTLQNDLYGLAQAQVKELDEVYEKYRLKTRLSIN